MTDLLDVADAPTNGTTPAPSWSAPTGAPSAPATPSAAPSAATLPTATPAALAPATPAALSPATPAAPSPATPAAPSPATPAAPSPATPAAPSPAALSPQAAAPQPTETPLLPEVPAFAVAETAPRQNRTQSPPGSDPLPGTLPFDFAALQAPAKAQPLVRWGSIVKTVFWICFLAALGYLGALYGPEYYDRYFGDEAADAEVSRSIADESPAPLAFPAATTAPAIASATFEVVGTGSTGSVVYEVTTDFASSSAQTFVNRPGAASLEVITVGDQALIRRTDDDTWYRTLRGTFPFNGRIDRQQWVRLVDELFPAELRSITTIEAASHSTVEGVPARRMVVSVPASRLAPPPSLPSLQGQLGIDATSPAPPAPPGSAGSPGSPGSPGSAVSPATSPVAPVDGAVAPPPASPPNPADVPAVDGSVTANPTTAPIADPPTAPAAADPAVQLEIWVDDAGVVRQAIGEDVFGVERLTVTSTMAAPWAPVLPSEDAIRPLDAEAAVYLGL